MGESFLQFPLVNLGSYVMYGSVVFLNIPQLLSSLWSNKGLTLQCGKHVAKIR